jgi:predicted transposase YbfD/YdcC
LPKKTFELAEKAKAILVTQVKDNQKSLKKQTEHGCAIQKPIGKYADEIDKQHGRIEKREYELFDASPMLDKWKSDWPYIRQVVKVTRFRQEIRKEPTIEIAYYVTNGQLEVEELAGCIRDHWFIENKLHHVKDRTFREDYTTKRVNPWIFSTIIDFGLNIMKRKNVDNVRSSLYENVLDFEAFFKNYRELLCL